ncbi:MAG TPA: SGNH/GDSL hydrolase family protein [Pyrinomonadaceae bacterium]
MKSTVASDPSPTKRLPLRRRILFTAIIYLFFLLLLFAVELIVRATLPHVSSLDLFVSTPQQRLQVADQKQRTIFEGDPLLLWRLKPNLKDVVWDFTVLSTNAEGVRAGYPTAAKPAATFRIVCVGDSVTFGYRVPAVWPDRPTEYDPNALPFPMLLEKELRTANPSRQIEVFPLAVPGYTSQQGLAWLKRDIDELQPDLVITSFGWNDASMSDTPDREAIRTDCYPVSVRWLIDHSQALAHATRWLRQRNAPTGKSQRRPQPRVSEYEYVGNIRSIVQLAQEHQSKAIVLGAPYRDSTTNPGEAARMTKYRSHLRAVMEEAKVPYLEVLELTEAASPANEGFFGELIHPNHIGHRLLASELLKLMKRDQLLGGLNIPEMVP